MMPVRPPPIILAMDGSCGRESMPEPEYMKLLKFEYMKVMELTPAETDVLECHTDSGLTVWPARSRRSARLRQAPVPLQLPTPASNYQQARGWQAANLKVPTAR